MGEKRISGKWGGINEWYVLCEQNGSHLVRGGINFTSNDISQSVGGSETAVLYTKLAVYLVNLSGDSIKQRLWHSHMGK